MIMYIKVIQGKFSMTKTNKYLFAPLSLASLTLLATTLLSGAFLMSSSVSADNDSVVDQISITVPISCTLSGTGMTSHNANIANGTYTADIGTTTLTAFCNDNSGFSIYATGYTGNEIGATNSNKLVGTSASNNATIDTGTATSAGNPDVSNWAMKLATNSSATYVLTLDNGFGSYSAVPNSYTKVAHRASGTDIGTNAEGSTLTTTYGAYISKTQPADTYTGQVIYTLVHPQSAPAPIVCNPNGTTIGTNTSTDIKCMQDISSTNKSSVLSYMTLEQQYTLKDSRDGKDYTVSKLADGNVWMTQNLDLDLDSSKTYTNLDTDLGWNGTSYSTAAWTPSRSTYETAANNIHQWCNGGTWNSQYGYCEQNNTPESYDPGNLYWNGTISDWTDWNAYYNSCDYTTSAPSCNESLNPLSTYVGSTGTAQYHLGNYYNWAAAIASNDASVYGTYDATTGEYENLEADQSICPAGWTLPYATWNDSLDQSEGDFADLWSEYGWTDNDGFSNISTVWSAPLYFTPAGGFGGSLGIVGYVGFFWSSVALLDFDARNANFNVDGYAYPASNDSRFDGNSVRCLLR